jgi:hypothetical protein
MMNRFCVQCRKALNADDRFCTACGAQVAADTPPQAAEPVAHEPLPAQRATRPTAPGARAFALALAGVAVAAGAAFWALRAPQAPSTAPAAMTTAPPAAALTAAPQAPPPVAQQPSAAPARPTWSFSSNEDGVQLILLGPRKTDDDPGLLRFVCNLDDGTIWVNSRAILDDKVDALATQRHQLDLAIVGEGGRKIIAEGYRASAPEGTSVAWELPRDMALMRTFTAPEFAAQAPGLSIRAADAEHAESLAAFSQACPPVEINEADALGWGTQTSRNYGYRLDIPKGLLRIASGDRFGRRYESETLDGNLIVANRVNATQEPLLAAIRDELPKLDKATYERRTDKFVVLSGFSGGSIVYYKARATCDNANIAAFTLTYDAKARAVFDPLIARMAKSFDATMGANGEPLCP